VCENIELSISKGKFALGIFLDINTRSLWQPGTLCSHEEYGIPDYLIK
jgi:hypothetical protein